MSLPRYVEHGGRVGSPAPFLCEGGTLKAVVLDADPEALDRLVERALTVPAAGAVEYRAMGGSVLLQAGAFDRVRCLEPPFDAWGTVREVVATFWIPVVAGRERLGVFVAERFGFFAPYVIVDNPMSYAGGRDVLGYNKSQGRFTPESGVGDDLAVQVFGGAFHHDARAGWHELFSLTTLPGGGGPGAQLEGVGAVAGHLVPGLVGEALLDGDLELPGLLLAQDLLAAAYEGRGTQVFLKQFRDAGDGKHACYQATVEAGATFHAVRARPTGRKVRFELQQLDSHPLGAELGVASQTARAVLDVELSFTVERGVVTGPPGAAAAHP